MEQITNEQDHLLLDYLDGRLDGTRLEEFKQLLNRAPQLQARLDELRLVHRSLAASARLESPSQAFVTKVMDNLHSRTFSPTLSPKNGLLLLVGIIIAAGLLSVMVSAGIFDQFQGMISVDTAPVQKYIQRSVPSLPFNGKLVIKILIGLNLVLAFLILDRTVLRPFFQRRAGTLL